jgi:hypothetical protein
MRRLLIPLSALSLLAVVAACASGDEDPTRYREIGRGGFGRGGGGDDHGPRQGLLNLFISPAGKPYRGQPGQPYPVAAWFAAADTDHDGKITPEEFRKDAEAFFHELDTNHDGVIDGFEVQDYEQKVAPEILPNIEGLGAGEGMDLTLGHRGDRQNGPEIGGNRANRGGRVVASDRRPQGAGVFGLLNEPQPVAATDTSFDGKITVAEFKAAADRRFAILDTKHLGYLTLADLPKTPAQEAAEREAARRAKAKAQSR